MSRCIVFVELDHPPDEVLVPGQVVTGSVEVSVLLDVRCNGLNVGVQWQTHGRGMASRGPLVPTELFKGEWKAGQDLSFPFELTVPRGPSTYEGTLVNIGWFISATANIPWALDVHAWEEVLVDASATDPFDNGPGFVHGLQAETPGQQVLTLLGGLIGAGFSVTVGVAMGEWIGLSMMLPMFVVGSYFVWSSVSKRLARTKLGEVDLELIGDPVPGGAVDLLLHFNPHADVEVQYINTQLTWREEAISSDGTNQTTHQETIFEDYYEQPGRPVAAGERAVFSQTLHIPAHAGPCFAAGANKVIWAAKVTLAVASWPDWVGTIWLPVRPARPSAGAAR